MSRCGLIFDGCFRGENAHTVHIQAASSVALPPPRDTADEMAKKVKITEAVRAAMLRRIGGKLVPDVAHDTEIRRFALIIKTERAFWALFFQPQGVNPATGKRWGGGKRVELGDAF